MINTKKIIALGLIAATGASMIATTTASAAALTGSGNTTVSYTPGQSTGGDGSGNGTVANWTVDYPMSASVSDSNTSATTAKLMTFSLLNTKDGGKADTPYSGDRTVDVSLKKPTEGLSGNAIQMSNGTGLEQKVTLALTKDNKTDLDLGGFGSKDTISVASLQKKGESDTKNQAKVGAFLKDKSGASKDKQYTTSLTWVFTGNEQ